MVLSLQSPGQPCFPSVVCADMQRTACQLALLAGPRRQVLTGLHHPRVTHCPWRGSTQPLRGSADTARPKVASQHHASLAQGPEENKPYPPSGRTFQELREGLPEAESKGQASGGGEPREDLAAARLRCTPPHLTRPPLQARMLSIASRPSPSLCPLPGTTGSLHLTLAHTETCILSLGFLHPQSFLPYGPSSLRQLLS